MKTIKLFLTTIAVLLCSVMANAHDFEVNGIFYNILSSTDLTVEVTCKGMSASSYQEYSGVVIIPSSVTYNGRNYSVTNIGWDAFRGCSSLTSISIPNSVTSIGSSAFVDCSSLTSVTIGESVTSIGSHAFYGCSSLTSVTIGESVTSIGYHAFYGCSSLTSVTIPNSVTSIEQHTFYGCSSLTSVTIGESVTSIGDYAFRGCSSLTSISIPNSVTSIGDYAFYGCSSLTSVTIPNSVTSIEDWAFSYCSSLTSVTIPNSVTSIGSSAFFGCIFAKDNFVNNSTLDTEANNYWGAEIADKEIDGLLIRNNTVIDCRETVTSVEIPNSVTSIESFAFNGCSSLTSVTIPNSVTSIEDFTFNNCSNLQSLTIGAGVLFIGSYQSYPAKVIWLPNTPPSGYKNLAGTINYIPNNQYSLTNAYIYPFLSSIFETDGVKYIPISPSDRTCDVIDCIYDSTNLQIAIDSTVIFQGVEMKTKNIMPYAFCKNDFIREVSLGNSGNIERLAFENCSNLQTTTIFNKGDIGISAFENCSNLRIATISNIGTIESDAFKGCSSLTTAGLGDSIKALGDNAFYQCSSLQAITIPNSVESVGKYCFSGCSNMISAVIGDGLATIKDYTFQHCSALESLIIGNHVTTIETYAFENCSSLPNIIIPQSVRSIDNNAFKGCASLADVIIEDRSTKLELGSNGSSPLFADCPLDSIYIGGKITYNTSKNSGYSPFYRNTSLRTITITDQEEQIYENEFYGCTNLKNVTIGHGIKNIGNRAFSGCSSLDKFSFGSNVESIGEEAFSDCTKMTELTSYSVLPPICGANALDDINKWSCVLKVPQNYKTAYQAADQWKEFFFIEDVVEVKKYAVTYMVDNEIFATDSLAVGESIVPIAEPAKEGYTFSGWSNIPETMPAEDITITGTFTVNTYTITYMVDEEIFATDTVAYGDTIVLIAEPSKEGYTFSGWSEVPEIMPAEVLVVTGSFVRNTYTITYVVDSVVYATDSITYGDTIALLDEPTQEGYTFSGWSEVPEIMPAEDLVVTGSFVRNTYTITYVVDSVVYATDSITYGDTIALLDEPTQEGYTFSGWSDAPVTMPAEDIIIEGSFNVNYYALKYIVDNEPFATDSLAYGDTIILREEPQKEDFEFCGWSEVPETMPAHDVEVYGSYIFTSTTNVKVNSEQSQKVVEDNQLFIILPNGKKFNVMGQEVGN